MAGIPIRKADLEDCEVICHALDFYLQAGCVEGERYRHRFRQGGAIDCIQMTRELRSFTSAGFVRARASS